MDKLVVVVISMLIINHITKQNLKISYSEYKINELQQFQKNIMKMFLKIKNVNSFLSDSTKILAAKRRVGLISEIGLSGSLLLIQFTIAIPLWFVYLRSYPVLSFVNSVGILSTSRARFSFW